MILSTRCFTFSISIEDWENQVEQKSLLFWIATILLLLCKEMKLCLKNPIVNNIRRDPHFVPFIKAQYVCRVFSSVYCNFFWNEPDISFKRKKGTFRVYNILLWGGLHPYSLIISEHLYCSLVKQFLVFLEVLFLKM